MRLAAIVESSEDAILSKDLDGVLESWNGGAERLFGYTAAEAVGRPVTMLIPPDRLFEEPVIIERIRRGERVGHYETVRLRKDGSPVDVSLSVSPVKDGEGFGSLLVRVTLTSQFGGEIRRNWTPEGLDVEMSILTERLKG